MANRRVSRLITADKDDIWDPQEAQLQPKMIPEVPPAAGDFLLSHQMHIVQHPDLSHAEKSSRLTPMFIKAVSNNDKATTHLFLSQDHPFRQYVDINAADEEGTPALVYAACFGYQDMCELLLKQGAQVDIKDKRGWTALLWAAQHDHMGIVALLKEQGASMDIVVEQYDTTIGEMIQKTSQSSLEDSSASFEEETSSMEPTASLSLASTENHQQDDTLSSADVEIIQDDDEESLMGRVEEASLEPDVFHWNKCNLDEMLVFDDTKVDHILDVAIHSMRPSKNTLYERPLSADILFLCMRYAHYFHTSDFLTEFFNKAVDTIISVVQEHKRDIHFVAYWIANSTQLLYYVRKDTAMMESDADLQCNLSELIQALSSVFIKDIQHRIANVLDVCILDYESTESTDRQVVFEGLFAGMSRKKTLLKSASNAMLSAVPKGLFNRFSISSPHLTLEASPKTICTLLDQALSVLKLYKVHPTICHYIFNQTFYCMGAEIFNGILTHHERCCRSRGVEIRMHLSALEEWVRDNKESLSPDIVTKYLKMPIHLTHFLQVISSIEDLSVFLETMRSLDGFTLAQAKLVLEHYKYEVGETSVLDQVEDYVVGVVQGVALHQSEKQKQTTSSLLSPLLKSLDQTDSLIESVEEEQDQKDVLLETLDVSYCLPFHVPHLIGDQAWLGVEFSPIVPSDIIDCLDNK